MAKQKPMPSPNATPNPSLSSSQAMQLLALRRAGVDQKTINDFLANPPVLENNPPSPPIMSREERLEEDIIRLIDQVDALEQWRVGIDQQLREIRLTLLQLQKRYDAEEEEWPGGWNG